MLFTKPKFGACVHENSEHMHMQPVTAARLWLWHSCSTCDTFRFVKFNLQLQFIAYVLIQWIVYILVLKIKDLPVMQFIILADFQKI